MLGAMLGAGNTVVGKALVVPVLMEVAVWCRTEASNDQLKESEKGEGSVV